MKAAVVGVGAIGSPIAAGLIPMAGIDTVVLIDGDRVELSNLARQPWYRRDDIGALKVEALARALAGGGAEVVRQPSMLTADTAGSLLDGVDVVFDGTDNWAARTAMQSWALAARKPWVFASALRWEGMARLFLPDAPCLFCLFGEAPMAGPRCFEAGIVGAVTLAVAGQALGLFERWRQGDVLAGAALWLIDGYRGQVSPVYRRGGCEHGRAQPGTARTVLPTDFGGGNRV